MSPLSSEANGSRVFQSGCWGASAFTRSKANTTWNGTGFSDQSVPSLSKVAMRSGGGTKSGPPSRVTRATKSTIDFLAAPSFHDGSGSAGRVDGVAGALLGVGSLLQPEPGTDQERRDSSWTATGPW